jgi:hypothetical protein
MKLWLGLGAAAGLSVCGLTLATAAPTTLVQEDEPVGRVSAPAGLSIDRGQGFVDVGPVAMVWPGDVIRAHGDGTLNYADGCDVEVERLENYTVREGSPCMLALVTQGAGTVGAGGTAGVAGAGTAGTLGAGGVLGLSTTTGILAATSLGALVAYGASEASKSEEDEDDPGVTP